MNNQRVQLQPAYLLHQRPYRDTSIIADVFSAEYGRFSLVARGVRQPRSKLRATLQPFQPLLLSWISKGEMGTLTQAEFQGKHFSVPPQFLPSAFYLNELLLYLLHRHDAHIELFSCYDRTLRALSRMSKVAGGDTSLRVSSLQVESLLRQFELSLLDATGYGLVLDHDIQTGEAVSEDGKYEVVIGHGVTRRSETSDVGNMIINGKTLKALSNVKTLDELGGRQGDHVQMIFREAKYLLRTVIDYYLGQKTLRSREMFAAKVRSTETLTSSALAGDT